MRLSTVSRDIERQLTDLRNDLPSDWQERLEDIIAIHRALNDDLEALEHGLSGDALEPTGADG